jgi:hypothetical protein
VVPRLRVDNPFSGHWICAPVGGMRSRWLRHRPRQPREMDPTNTVHPPGDHARTVRGDDPQQHGYQHVRAVLATRQHGISAEATAAGSAICYPWDGTLRHEPRRENFATDPVKTASDSKKVLKQKRPLAARLPAARKRIQFSQSAHDSNAAVTHYRRPINAYLRCRSRTSRPTMDGEFR